MSELNKTLDRALMMLNQIAKEEAVGVRELSRLTGASLAVTERIVKTLEQYQFVERDEFGKIVLGRELYILGKIVESKINVLQIMAQEIKKLVEDIDESAYLVERRGKYSIFIEGVQSSHPIQYLPEMGKLYDLPYGATGKAFLAYMKDDEAKEIMELFKVDQAKITADLLKVRRDGYAITSQERFPGLAGIAFPLVNKDGEAMYVLDIAIPMYRYTDEKSERIINRARNTVEKILTFMNS